MWCDGVCYVLNIVFHKDLCISYGRRTNYKDTTEKIITEKEKHSKSGGRKAKKTRKAKK